MPDVAEAVEEDEVARLRAGRAAPARRRSTSRRRSAAARRRPASRRTSRGPSSRTRPATRPPRRTACRCTRARRPPRPSGPTAARRSRPRASRRSRRTRRRRPTASAAPAPRGTVARTARRLPELARLLLRRSAAAISPFSDESSRCRSRELGLERGCCSAARCATSRLHLRVLSLSARACSLDRGPGTCSPGSITSASSDETRSSVSIAVQHLVEARAPRITSSGRGLALRVERDEPLGDRLPAARQVVLRDPELVPVLAISRLHVRELQVREVDALVRAAEARVELRRSRRAPAAPRPAWPRSEGEGAANAGTATRRAASIPSEHVRRLSSSQTDDDPRRG